MTEKLNESVCKVAKEAQEEEMHTKIEEDSRQSLLHSGIASGPQKEAALNNELAMEKIARKQKRKEQSKILKSSVE